MQKTAVDEAYSGPVTVRENLMKRIKNVFCKTNNASASLGIDICKIDDIV